jgi:hypothetical protein
MTAYCTNSRLMFASLVLVIQFFSTAVFAQEQGAAIIPPSRITAWSERKPVDEWWFKETINPMTDRKSWVVAFVMGGMPGGYQAQFFCDDDDWTGFYIFGPGMNIGADKKYATKRSRIDNNNPRVDQWWQSTKLDEIVINKTEDIAHAMYDGKDRFVIEDITGKSIVFPLKGFRGAATALNAKCPWFMGESHMKARPKWFEKLLGASQN